MWNILFLSVFIMKSMSTIVEKKSVNTTLPLKRNQQSGLEMQVLDMQVLDRDGPSHAGACCVFPSVRILDMNKLQEEEL